jgi:hypothetical protein
MGVILTSISDTKNRMHVSNSTWESLTQGVPGVAPWNRSPETITYTPSELRAIAEKDLKWGPRLCGFADDGGAVLKSTNTALS